ncbi:Enoyl-CoA hydratase/isomerase [Streptomyces hygroscopicus subsp. jinggangensis 5008]|nr:Enoyl-CoA hydratase/isomerase [Streptomyces hygroscopicus subsp. jinggangensis 5008]AGF60289.1 Enoyl-CoA hydratase/isomerase [Streptomyces hygroscopicus subsp. jinggangensis TL01]
MPVLDRQNDVFVLDLGGGENRVDRDWVTAVDAALEEVEEAEGPRALVTTGTGRFYSNGLDLDRLSAHEEERHEFTARVHGLFARLLCLPVITVAAVQGHAFGAGAIFSLAHDFRVMRADRGYWCLPEADMGMPFPRGMAALVQARLSPRIAREAMLTSRRYGGAEAEAAHIADRAVAEDAVRGTALEIAAAHAAKAGDALGTTKARMFPEVLAALRDVGAAQG